MKNLFTVLVIIIFNFSFFGQKGVIYNFAFRIDNELVTQMKTQNKDYKILNISTVEEMPKELSDTILLVTENSLGKFLNSELYSMRPEEKMVMAALPEHLMYLPANMFKKAVKANSELNHYIDISCHIAASGGVEIVLGKESYSRVKPKLTLSIKIYNVEKTLLDSKEVILKDFGKLRSHKFEETYGIKGLVKNTDEVTISETINDNDVLKMYTIALTEALK